MNSGFLFMATVFLWAAIFYSTLVIDTLRAGEKRYIGVVEILLTSMLWAAFYVFHNLK